MDEQAGVTNTAQQEVPVSTAPTVDMDYDTVDLGSKHSSYSKDHQEYMVGLERSFAAAAKSAGLSREQAAKMGAHLIQTSSEYSKKMWDSIEQETAKFESSLEYKVDDLDVFSANYIKEHKLPADINLASKDTRLLMQHLKKQAGAATHNVPVAEQGMDRATLTKKLYSAKGDDAFVYARMLDTMRSN